MKRFSVGFLDRAFNAVPKPSGVTFEPLRWGRSRKGGDKFAVIKARGSLGALQNLSAWLRYGVRITDHADSKCFFGFLNTWEMVYGNLRTRISLDGMTNSVRIAYTLRNPDGSSTAKITAAASDAFSQNYYGVVKERILRAGTLSDAGAEALRDQNLAHFRRYSGIMEPAGREANQPAEVTLECLGWMATLDWRHVEWAAADQSYFKPNQYAGYGRGVQYYPTGFVGSSGDDWLELGGSDATRGIFGASQSFIVDTVGGPQAMRVKDVAFWLERINSPSGFNVIYRIYKDNAGAVGTVIGTVGSKAATEVSDGQQWNAITKDSATPPIWIIPGQRYRANIERDGVATSASDVVGVTLVNPGNGPAAEAMLEQATSGGGWAVPRRGAGDLNLQVVLEHDESWLDIGGTSARQIIEQGFQIGGTHSVTLTKIRVRGCKANSPTDNLRARIYTGAGVLLHTETISGAGLPTAIGTIEIPFTSGPTLAPATTYKMRLDRDGALDNANFYILCGSLEKGYAGGATLVYNGTAFVTPTPDIELLFEIETEAETTAMLASAITEYGPLLTGVDVRTTSSIYEPIAHDGETTALYEIERWLDTGNSSAIHLNADVDANRRVVVDVAPEDVNGPALYMNRGGRIVTFSGEDRGRFCPVGQWIAPRELAVEAGDSAPSDGRLLFYVEECEYDAQTDTATPRMRGQADPFDTGGII